MYGTYETIDGTPAVRFERVYPHAVDRVWRMITVPEEMAAWFPSTVEVDLREGGEMTFTFPDREVEPMTGRVLELDPPRVFAFLWGTDLLRLELAPDGDGTRLDAHPAARQRRRGRAQRRRLARLPRQARRRGDRLGAALRRVRAPGPAIGCGDSRRALDSASRWSCRS